MGVIERIFTALFGGGRNLVKDTAEVFVENAEAGAAREAVMRGDALAQFGREFASSRQGRFDAFMDGVNRLPRPLMALGTIGLFVSAMSNPVWFAARMQGIALVPEPLWWILGAIISFYFGARHQVKGQEFQRQLAQNLSLLPTVTRNLQALEALEQGALMPGKADASTDAALTSQGAAVEENLALNDWSAGSASGR